MYDVQQADKFHIEKKMAFHFEINWETSTLNTENQGDLTYNEIP